jgi:glycosyltransferase involved in cell wall biosynthesis
MRIALFHDLPSGGAKRTAHELVKRLAARHHIEVYALSTADEQFGDLRPIAQAYHRIDYQPSPLLGRPFGRFNPLRRWLELGRLEQLSRRLAATIDAARYDVVLAEPSMWTQAPLILSSLATPAAYDLREPPRALYEPGLNDRATNGLRRALDRLDPLPVLYRARARRLDRDATRAARRVVVNSHFVAAHVRRIYGCEPRVVYLGVDVDRFRPLGDAARRHEVLSVGALQPSKGFDFLIHALAHLAAGERPLLRIVANAELPGERSHLERLAREHEVPLALEVGIDDAELARRYAEAAALVYAPHQEPFGLAALEAMACATPVVAVGEGGVVESVRDQVTGVIVPREPRRFADAVRSLLDDTRLRRRLGDAAREEMCARWTWAHVVDRMESELTGIARCHEPSGAAA